MKNPIKTPSTRKSIVFVLAGLLISGSGFNAQALQVRASAPCGVWVKDRNEKSWGADMYQAGLLGYLSGLVAGVGKDALKGTDNESIFLWMDNYCGKNPLGHSYDGGQELFRELVKKKNL